MSTQGFSNTRTRIMQEAVRRQGSVIQWDSGEYHLRLRINGDPSRVYFETGSEGLVHLVIDEPTQRRWRIKCFWQPDQERRQRCEALTKQQLADAGKSVADALGGAPLSFCDNMGGETRFSVLMKDVGGSTWEDWLDRGRAAGQSCFPISNWPSLRIRLTWAIGLAVAVDKMEERGFIHADISPRNVMVTAEGKHKGDMALVDFDGFVCAAYQIPDTHLKGSEGFAAPEIWEQESLTKGSDRVGMAILIEQFLTAGQPTVPYKEALFWEYSQQELVSLKSRANPHFRRLYPELADVLDKTLSASSPEERPSPKMWEELLFKEYSRAAARPEPPTRLDTPSSRQATSTNTRSSGVVLRRVEISSDSSSRAERIQLADVAARLDLSNSSFQIRADLVRHADGTITLEVHDRAEVRVRDSSGVWRRIAGGDFIPVASDLEFYDTQGANKARLTGERISLAS